jgi:hypothetical protein
MYENLIIDLLFPQAGKINLGLSGVSLFGKYRQFGDCCITGIFNIPSYLYGGKLRVKSGK